QLTILSVHEAQVFVLSALLLFYVIGGLKKGSWCLLAFLVFIAWGVLVPRPMGRLVTDLPDTLLIDFHSHTSFSHDGRPSFTPDHNRQWHRLQGYDASFITDHNRVDGAETAKR